jgi:putative PIN family toxin of toxin-antitoxin system
MRRSVFDTSTLISATLLRNSIAYHSLLKALAEGILCASAETLDELDSVLEREKFERYLELVARREFGVWVRRNCSVFWVEMYEDMAGDPPCRNEKDKKFLALADVAAADVIVSSDIHLLELSPWRGIPILKPAAFLELCG